MNAPFVPQSLRRSGSRLVLGLFALSSLLAGAPAAAADLASLGLAHDSFDEVHRFPSGAVASGTPVRLRLRCASRALSEARLVVHDARTDRDQLVAMTRIGALGGSDWWEATYAAPAGGAALLSYRFAVKAVDGTAAVLETLVPGTGGGSRTVAEPTPGHRWFIGVYQPSATPPAWAAGRMGYRVVLDRFRDGDPSTDLPAGTFFYGEPGGTNQRCRGVLWNTPMAQEWGKAAFYGGDFQGLLDKVDYLQSLGVDLVVLDPIFAASSSHGMDPTDLLSLDPRLGTVSLLDSLVSEMEARGMKVVFEAGVQALSSDSPKFDRYSRHAVEGACESVSSPFRNWFRPHPGGPCAGDVGFETAPGHPERPKLDLSQTEVRNHLWAGGASAVLPFWSGHGHGWVLRDAHTLGIDSVSWPRADWWNELGSAARSARADLLLVGEASSATLDPWLLEGVLDGASSGLGSQILGFWREKPFHTGGVGARIDPLSPSELDARVRSLRERLPPAALVTALNALRTPGEHRALLLLDPNNDGTDATFGIAHQNPNYDWSGPLGRLKGAALLQMTLPGIPVVDYGDEVGLVGPSYPENGLWQAEPYDAPPFPWLDSGTGTPFYSHLQTSTDQAAMVEHYQLLGQAHASHPALRLGGYRPLLVDDATGVYAFARLLEDRSDVAIVAVNRSGTAVDVAVSVAGWLPVGAQLLEVLRGGAPQQVDPLGQIALRLEARGGTLLVLGPGPLTSAPEAPTGLFIQWPDTLQWNASLGADSYDVYWSPDPSLGWEWLATATGPSSVLPSARERRFYRVVARDDLTLLRSPPSEPLELDWRTPIGWCGIMPSPPQPLQHTLGQAAPTLVTVDVWADQATGPYGPLADATVEVGYGPRGSTPSPAWTWSPVSLVGASSNNDRYQGALVLETAGAFDYAPRASRDGATWLYGQQAPLEVSAGSDATAPARPTGLEVVGASDSELRLGWTANTEADLAGYDLERREAGQSAWTRIARLGAQQTGTVDWGMPPGTAWDYRLTAFDGSFNRSAPSDVLTARAQTRRITVTFSATVPDLVPGTIYLAGEHAALGAGAPDGVALQELSPRVWQATVSLREGTRTRWWLTRGDEQTDETLADGARVVRELTVAGDASGDQTVSVTVLGWRDPVVVAVSPAAGSTDAAATATLSVVWDRAMQSAGTLLVQGPGGAVAGTLTHPSPETFEFRPSQPWAFEAWHSVTVSDALAVGTGTWAIPVRQRSPAFWRFRTQAAPEPELCNGVDDDGDPGTPDGADEPWLGNACDGSDNDLCSDDLLVCDHGLKACVDVPHASTESCNGLDDDCDGNTDEELPPATCGVGACHRAGSSCDPASCTPGTAGPEICGDDIDQDCDGADLACVVDAGTSDAGTPEDAGRDDSGLADAGLARDAEVFDAAAADAGGPLDAGAFDAATADAGGPLDAAVGDAATADASAPVDAAVRDAASADAAEGAAGWDAGSADGAVVRADAAGAEPVSGCGCSGTGGPVALSPWLVVLALAGVRRPKRQRTGGSS